MSFSNIRKHEISNITKWFFNIKINSNIRKWISNLKKICPVFNVTKSFSDIKNSFSNIKNSLSILKNIL